MVALPLWVEMGLSPTADPCLSKTNLVHLLASPDDKALTVGVPSQDGYGEVCPNAQAATQSSNQGLSRTPKAGAAIGRN